MLPPPKKKEKKKVFCKSSIIPEASPVPNGSIEEKLKSLGKCLNTTQKKKKKNSVPVTWVWRLYAQDR